MMKKTRLRHAAIAAAATIAMGTNGIASACTSLLYTDATGAPYSGRTMELPMELPYKVAYYPVGSAFDSKADDNRKLSFETKHAFVSLAVPDPVSGDLKVVEGLNSQGLSFSLLAFASTDGPKAMVDKTHAVLAAIDLGAWTLGQFKSVAEVKAALNDQPVLVTALLPLGILKTPFHYTLHDAQGKSLVIEFANGKQQVVDNPVGVMTNGPEFSWHMTNLNNYTFLNNEDQSKLEINGRLFQQPDSGIATVGLPASNTSVGRFVRAVYYSQFAEKAETPEKAITTLAHVMNNFDRPRGITVDNRFKGNIENITAPGLTRDSIDTTEYTSWTALSDLRRLQFNVRTYHSMNYVSFDLAALLKEKDKRVIELNAISAHSTDGTTALLGTAR